MLRSPEASCLSGKEQHHWWQRAIDKLCMHVIRASCSGDLRPRCNAPCCRSPGGAPAWHPLPVELSRGITISHSSMACSNEIETAAATSSDLTTAAAPRPARPQRAEAARSRQASHDSDGGFSGSSSRTAACQGSRQQRRRSSGSVADVVRTALLYTDWHSWTKQGALRTGLLGPAAPCCQVKRVG